MKKILSLLFLCAGMGLVSNLVYERWQFQKLSAMKKLQQLWAEDLQVMAETSQLPKEWSSIREIELTPGSEDAMDWLKALRVPVEVDKEHGKYKLQVMLVLWEDEGKQGALMQYDLVDLDSGNDNTVWETNRTFLLTSENSWLDHWIQFALPRAHLKDG